MNNEVYECGNTKCANAIAISSLSGVQLEALRRWAKTCKKCGKTTRWMEKVLLLDINTINAVTSNGDTSHANRKNRHINNQERTH